ncbi:MAG: hypothetical protein GQ564_00970 [Bacteroidales bacterium]|nr:hypothetical protein [Bacteroidales bacterium]
MAEKGFNLKVIIPTDDGLIVSSKGIEKASYYLMYNASNRSYQLAGKIKTSEYFKNQKFDSTTFKNLCDQNNVDEIVDCKDFTSSEISEVLNKLIDFIDKKTS